MVAVCILQYSSYIYLINFYPALMSWGIVLTGGTVKSGSLELLSSTLITHPSCSAFRVLSSQISRQSSFFV